MNTVYVIGAGASAELNFPIGDTLKKDIRDELKAIGWDSWRRPAPPNLIYSGMVAHSKDSNNESAENYRQATEQIISGIDGARSIDSYLHQHEEDEFIKLIGKLAVVDRILFRERASKLFLNRKSPPNEFSFESVENTWYQKFWYSLTNGMSAERLDSRFNQVTLIIFNYDRCVEHFLFHALQRHYRSIDRYRAKELIDALKIYHPYGHVGTLPWQSVGDEGVEFGAKLDGRGILDQASLIKTFSESSEDNIVAETCQAISVAQRVVYLGFGFVSQNLKYLFGQNTPVIQKVFATCHGMSEDNIKHIRRTVSQRRVEVEGRFELNISTSKCAEFFDEYERSLEFD